MSTSKQRHPIHTFDIDSHLNHIVPRPRFDVLPTSISRWFGYRPPRKDDTQSQPQPSSVLLVWLFAFLGAFVGIAIIENVFMRLPRLDGTPVPIVIASFGAAAILEYNTIESPLSQPRNLILGHALSAAIGVGITKLFLLLPSERFMELRWVAGALSVGAASTTMAMTKTVHPPAGATALLAATSPEVLDLGWWLIVLVLLGAGLMLSSAMLVNNLYKRFPLYWWTPADLSKSTKSNIVQVKDVERGESASDSSSHLNSLSEVKRGAHEQRKGSDIPEAEHDEDPLDTVARKQRNIHDASEAKVSIETDRIVVPDWMQLSSWEAQVLESFQKKLRG